MASTTFTDQQTVIYAAWLNDVNNAVYNGVFANGVLNVTTVNTTNLVATNATIGAFSPTTINLPNSWSISTTASKLYFTYNGTNVASLDTSGNFTALNDINGVNVSGNTSTTP
jgi:hypothetical protein